MYVVLHCSMLCFLVVLEGMLCFMVVSNGFG